MSSAWADNSFCAAPQHGKSLGQFLVQPGPAITSSASVWVHPNIEFAQWRNKMSRHFDQKHVIDRNQLKHLIHPGGRN
jgi:hypothetical protein